jgi:hypothetical protein
MNEDILVAALGLNEAEAFLAVISFWYVCVQAAP